MTDIMHSFDDTTATWPDIMDPHILHVGEWTLNENFYVQQLSTLPLFSITQLQAYNDGLIHDVTNNLDPTFLLINGTLSSSIISYEWVNQQSPCLLEFWRHWSLHSEEIVSQPPFLDTSDPDPVNRAQPQTASLVIPQDIQHLSLGGAPVHTVQQILSQIIFDPSMHSMELSDISSRLQLTTIPTQANGVIYNGFPPENFHHSRTASWFYCPFFLQAANQGVPVLNLHIPQEFTQRYNELLHRAGSSRLLPTLGQLFQTFDAPMHISTALQNALLAHIDQTFGQEMELLLAEIFMQFAPQQYWDMQQIPRPAGARLRNRLTITPQPNPPPTVGPVSSTTPLTSTPDDPTSYDTQVLRAVPPSQDMDTDPTGNGTTPRPLQDDAPQQPTQTGQPTPGPRTRFPRCPPGDICPRKNQCQVELSTKPFMRDKLSE